MNSDFKNAMWIVGVISLSLIFPITHCSQQMAIENQVTVDVQYCTGKRDTVHMTIVGETRYIHINNRGRVSKHSKQTMAVPELVSYSPTSTEPVLLYNVCWFNIINENRIK